MQRIFDRYQNTLNKVETKQQTSSNLWAKSKHIKRVDAESFATQNRLLRRYRPFCHHFINNTKRKSAVGRHKIIPL